MSFLFSLFRRSISTRTSHAANKGHAHVPSHGHGKMTRKRKGWFTRVTPPDPSDDSPSLSTRGCRRSQPMDPSDRHIYAKAFLVWILFTAAGWISIPSEFLPFFSHCVGFGFFLTITTRKTRWLGALTIAALIIYTAMYQTIPQEWMFTASTSAGYLSMGVVLVLACLCTAGAVDPSIREEIRSNMMSSSHDFLTKGALAMDEIRAHMHRVTEPSSHSSPESIMNIDTQEPEETLRLPPGEQEHASLVTMVRNLNATLLSHEQDARSTEERHRATITKLQSRLDEEVEKRLRVERQVEEKDRHIASLSSSWHDEKQKLITSWEDERKLWSIERISLSHIVSTTPIKQRTISDEMCRSTTCITERENFEKQIVKLKQDKDTLDSLLSTERSSHATTSTHLHTSQQHIKDLTSTCDKHVTQIQTLQQQLIHIQSICDEQKIMIQSSSRELTDLRQTHTHLQQHIQHVTSQLSTATSQIPTSPHQHPEYKEMIQRITLYRHILGLDHDITSTSTSTSTSTLTHELSKHMYEQEIEELSLEQLDDIERAHRSGLDYVRDHRAHLVSLENARLKSQNHALQEQMMCRVCLANMMRVVFLPCGHACACTSCAQQLTACPLCRSTITHKKDIYM